MTVTLQKTQTLFHKMYWKVPVVRMCKFGLTAIAAKASDIDDFV